MADRVVRSENGEGEEPPFLSGRKTSVFGGASPAILLTGHVPAGASALVVTIAPKNFPLRTNQVVALIDEGPSENHAGLPPGMDGIAGGDVPLFQQFTRRTLAVTRVSGQGSRLQW